MGHSPLLNTPQLILITDSSRLSGTALLEQIALALQGGVDTVLMREKQLDSAKALALASSLRNLTRTYQVRLIIHSFADIAIAVGADGIHLPSNEIASIPALRRWLMQHDAVNDMAISVSCHHADDLAQAAAFGVDFALLSPVFETASHPGEPCLGIDAFHNLTDQSPCPVVALGGIDTYNRHMLANHGVAVISALLLADDARNAAQLLRSEYKPLS